MMPENGVIKPQRQRPLRRRGEGLEKGILQTAREAILDGLDTRFGEVPNSVRERVNALETERTL
jgi:hypothetical protein